MYEEYIKQLHIEAKLRNLADSSIKTYTDFILRFRKRPIARTL